MPNEDFPVGRIELEKRPLQSNLNFISDRHAVAENREAIAELRQMLQAIIDHLGVSYPPNDFRAEE